VRNPLSLATSSTFQIAILTNNQNNEISKRTSGITVQNTEAGTIVNARAAPVNSDLGVTTSYLIEFTPGNTVEQNTVVTVTIPSQIGVDTSSAMT
jgi:hypothetical protein